MTSGTPGSIHPKGPALLWLLPWAVATEWIVVLQHPPQVREAIEGMNEQFITIAGAICLQRNTWYRNPWKTWAVVRLSQAGTGTVLRVVYASNPATTAIVGIGAAITFATLPLGDALLYVCTLGGVIALVGSFGRFVARGDVALLRGAIVRAVDAQPTPPAFQAHE